MVVSFERDGDLQRGKTFVARDARKVRAGKEAIGSDKRLGVLFSKIS
jgi:hypothetical protein